MAASGCGVVVGELRVDVGAADAAVGGKSSEQRPSQVGVDGQTRRHVSPRPPRFDDVKMLWRIRTRRERAHECKLVVAARLGARQVGVTGGRERVETGFAIAGRRPPFDRQPGLPQTLCSTPMSVSLSSRWITRRR